MEKTLAKLKKYEMCLCCCRNIDFHLLRLKLMQMLIKVTCIIIIQPSVLMTIILKYVHITFLFWCTTIFQLFLKYLKMIIDILSRKRKTKQNIT